MRSIFGFLLLVFLTSLTLSQEKVILCQSSSSPFGEQAVFIRKDWNNDSIEVVSWNTGETLRQLETSLPMISFESPFWSPDCRYFLGSVITDGDIQLYLWDTVNVIHIGTLPSQSNDRYRVNWSPNGTYVIVQQYRGGTLWELATNRQVLLNEQSDQYGRNFYTTEWDLDRNELLVVQIGSANGVTSYNLATGQQTSFYHIGERAKPVNYRRVNNNQDIWVFSTRRQLSLDDFPQGLAFWNRDTGQGIQLDPNNKDFSPEGADGGDRYGGFDLIGDFETGILVFSDYGVYLGYLYVWDLSKLSGNSPYIPNFQQASLQAGDIRLKTPDSLEVADWTVFAYSYEPHKLRIRLITLVTESVESEMGFYPSICNKNIEIFIWACERALIHEQNLPSSSSNYAGENNSVYYPPR